MSDDRATGERIAAVERAGGPITAQQRADATALLEDLVSAAAPHGVTLADFDWVTGLPEACVDVILQQARRRGER